ncbi:MAG TPA: AsmA-like C-terminal region-containing protein, partial [Burkholderiales bacterium]|nr:AsmA-like C-terminal region-containing protein [Burkholderiales bacterium]
RIGISLLDSSARLSGRLPEYRRGSGRIDASVSEGTAGKELVDWIWRRAELPDRLKPATPLQFSAQRVRWADAGLDLSASARFPAGPEVGIEFAFRPRKTEAWEIRKLVVKDRGSDALIRVVPRGRLIEASFSGWLTSQSIASMLAQAQGERPGKISGDLRIALDRDRLRRSTAQGKLAGEHLDLRELLPAPITLERVDVEADGNALRVREMTLDWAKQRASIRGEVMRQASGWAIRAELDSPGIILDALLPARETRDKTKPQEIESAGALKLWPLPVTGTIALRAGFLQFRQFRVEPVRAVLAVAPQRAELKADEAVLCGVAFPFSASATPGNVDIALRLSAKGQQLESVARCFSDRQLLLTGEFDLNARLTARGSERELLSTLAGPVEMQARRGEIRKFALLGNILSLKGIKELLATSNKERQEGFPYRQITVRGRFGGGRFVINEGALDSPALGLAATGNIRLADYQSSLTVLVAPFSRIDRLARSVPIVGYVMGGLFTSIPVGVSGDIRDPLVVPLGPKAVTAELLGIFERTLKLPAKLIEPAGTARPAD